MAEHVSPLTTVYVCAHPLPPPLRQRVWPTLRSGENTQQFDINSEGLRNILVHPLLIAGFSACNCASETPVFDSMAEHVSPETTVYVCAQPPLRQRVWPTNRSSENTHHCTDIKSERGAYLYNRC
jgi:hypothetical protein